jgi:D-3-phosphoglycerate dehydrogenase / 2-oxoglutarate reductase
LSEPSPPGQRFVILVTEPIQHPSLEILRSIGVVRLGDPSHRYTEDGLAEALEDCDAVLITSRDRITRAHIEGSPRLKVICKYGARPEKVDLEAAAERGVRVLSTPLANPESVAEHAILLILALQRGLRDITAGLRAGHWRDRVGMGTELAGKTVGLVGFGNVGSKLAQKLGGFGVRLLAYDPWLDEAAAARLNVEPADLDTLLRTSDVVSLHAMVTPQSRHMIGEAQLRSMKPTSLLINTARGPLVHEEALVRALEEGWIAGAGLDVFEEEPVPATNPLLKLDCVVATPHVAAHTREAMDRELTWAAEDVRRVLLGEAPIHC